MNEFENYLEKIGNPVKQLFQNIEALIYEVPLEVNKSPIMNSRAMMYYTGSNIGYHIFVAPFAKHITIFAPDEIERHKSILTGYEISSRDNMLKIKSTQRIPEILKKIFIERLGKKK